MGISKIQTETLTQAQKEGPAEAGLMHVSRFSSSTGTTQWSRQQGNGLLWPLVFCMARVAFKIAPFKPEFFLDAGATNLD
jgi:hypothetical protein